jgi:hypothetical protein
MATFYANGYGAALGKGASAGSAPDLSSPALLGGKLRSASFKYTAVGTEVASTSDTIKLCYIPKGARIYYCYFGCEDLASAAGTRITLRMGTTAISAAKDPNSAIATAVDLTAITGVTNANGVLVTAGNEEIHALVSGSSGALLTTSMWGLIFYAVE